MTIATLFLRQVTNGTGNPYSGFRGVEAGVSALRGCRSTALRQASGPSPGCCTESANGSCDFY